jgi:predicted secreted protein with PEFG-CTERM motif
VKIIYDILILALISGFTFSSAFAQSSIEIAVDRTSLTLPYEKFMITGMVKATQPIREIQITIYDPDGKVVYSPTIPLEKNGSFKNIARVESSWVTNGVYTIEATSSKLPDSIATTQVQLQKSSAPGTTIPTGPSIVVSGFTVGHNQLGKVQSASVNPEQKTVTFMLSGQITGGTISLQLPNGLITNPNAVWVDGVQVTDFEITRNSGSTTLSIPVNSDSKEVVIMGASVVPEFGSIAALILVIAIVSTIIVTNKAKNSLTPRI